MKKCEEIVLSQTALQAMVMSNIERISRLSKTQNDIVNNVGKILGMMENYKDALECLTGKVEDLSSHIMVNRKVVENRGHLRVVR